MDLAKLTPAPWAVTGWDGSCIVDDGGAPAPATFVIGNLDKPNEWDVWIAEMFQSDCQADAEFIALARNAFDVMMRRGWTAHLGNPEGNHPNDWNVVDKDGKPLWRVDLIAWETDPFTALVEANRWYTENIERSSK